VREEERKSLAREIHDQLGQALTAIKLDVSSLVQELPEKDGHVIEKSSYILEFIDDAIQTVRRICTELRPGILDNLGLIPTLEWAAEEFEERTGTKCALDLPQGNVTIEPEAATAVFRIFQETLTNIARHANAKHVKVRLSREGSKLALEVHDDGLGIDLARLADGGSLGILGMRERAMVLGGDLTITGEPGKGTTVTVRIPATAALNPERL
jgi:signal transduction histidine kinase